MSLIDKVLVAAKSLQDAGKQPSLALLKARTGGAVPMPILIQGLQTFRNMPDAEKDKIEDKQPTKATNEDEELSLSLLNKKLEKLEKKIDQLTANNTALEEKISQLQQGCED